MTVRVGSSTQVAALNVGQPTLHVGANGPAVRKLQQELTAAGFKCAADGAFGPETLKQVKAFQRAKHLDVDGVVGPATWTALNKASAPKPPAPPPRTGAHPTVQLGSKGPAVVEMQQALAKKGFSPGAADGDFGPKTLAALKRFQSSAGLAADGVCGPKTWQALTTGSVFTPPPPKPPAAHPTLKQGASGEPVRRLQTLLRENGVSPGAIDGQFGPGTDRAVREFQRSRGLGTDGVVGPKTWAALEAHKPPVVGPVTPPANGTTRDKILQLAQSQIGTQEGSNNDNPYSKYWGRNHEAWCADFVSWVYTKAGVNMNNSWCPGVESHLKNDGKWKGKSNPQPGDLVLFDWNHDGTADHIGIVKRVNSDGSLTTIEGNTGKPGGGPEGVWEKHRTMTDVRGFGNLY